VARAATETRELRKGHGDIVAREGLLEKRYFVLRATTSASNISLPIPGDESARADAPRGKRKIRNGVPWRSCSAYDSSLALTLSLSLSLSLIRAHTKSDNRITGSFPEFLVANIFLSALGFRVSLSLSENTARALPSLVSRFNKLPRVHYTFPLLSFAFPLFILASTLSLSLSLSLPH